MRELAPTHLRILQRLIAGGFTPVAFPMYPNAIGIRRGPVGALLEPEDSGSFRMVAPATYMQEGNFTVRIHRNGRDWFVWKGTQIEATPDLLEEVTQFSADLSTLLSSTPPPDNPR